MNRSFRLPRLWSNSVLAEIAPLFEGSVINVSGWDDRDKAGGRYRSYFHKASSYFVSNHEGERGLADSAAVTEYSINLEAGPDPELTGRFDVVFNHTVLEHVYRLGDAFRHLCQLSKDVVIVVVPFAQELHFSGSYGDYWRFTPMSLRKLFEDNGLEVVYEAANGHSNAGIYLLFVASRHPERWRDRLPAWQPIETLGGWIGSTRLRRLRIWFARRRRGAKTNEPTS